MHLRTSTHLLLLRSTWMGALALSLAACGAVSSQPTSTVTSTPTVAPIATAQLTPIPTSAPATSAPATPAPATPPPTEAPVVTSCQVASTERCTRYGDRSRRRYRLLSDCRNAHHGNRAHVDRCTSKLSYTGGRHPNLVHGEGRAVRLQRPRPSFAPHNRKRSVRRVGNAGHPCRLMPVAPRSLTSVSGKARTCRG